MSKKTEPAKIDITKLIPEVASLAAVSIRLHPFPDDSLPDDVSKIGGSFAWPKTELWPHCPDQRHKYATKTPLLAPVVQLRADDFPEIEFRPGSNLFQLLWCPVTEDSCDALMAPTPYSYWRKLDEINDRLEYEPFVDTSEFIERALLFQHCIPKQCRISPERVIEYPEIAALPAAIQDILTYEKEDIFDLYVDEEVGTCPASKVGGHPHWIQNDETPTCECGAKMEFLLQLPDWEYTNMHSMQRWIPLEDRWAIAAYDANREDQAALDILRPMRFDFSHYTKYIFVCRSCETWPVKLVEQN